MRDTLELSRLVLAGLLPNLAYLSLGLWLLAALRTDARGSERLALAYVVGTGAASLLLLGFGLFALAPSMFVLAVLVPAALPRLRDLRGKTASREPGWIRGVDAATLLLVVLTFAASLAPETYWDGFEYHLPMVQAWSEGGIRALPGFVDGEFRAGIDLLYLPAVAFGQPDAAAAVSACFAATLAALVRAEVRRRASDGAGALAGLFTLIAPIVLESAPSTYVDLGVGAYGFVALLQADRWNRTSEGGSLLLCAVALAFAANAKLHAAILVPAVGVMLALGSRPPPLRILVGPAALAAVLVVPWFVKTALTTGNPLFPFFAAQLGAGITTPEHLALRQFRLSTDFPTQGLGARILHYTASLATGRNPHLSGLVSALPFALAPLALHRLARPTAVLAAVLVPLFVLQILYMPALRFALPLWAVVAVAAGVGGERLARSGKLARAILGVALTLLIIDLLATVALRYGPRVAALEQPAAYEARIFPDQDALRQVVARAGPRVAIPKGAVSWMPHPVYVLHWERNGEAFFDPVLGRVTPPDAMLALLRERGVRSLVLDVAPPLPRNGSIGHPSVDAWIRSGRARVRPESAPLAAREGRVWVIIDLI